MRAGDQFRAGAEQAEKPALVLEPVVADDLVVRLATIDAREIVPGGGIRSWATAGIGFTPAVRSYRARVAAVTPTRPISVLPWFRSFRG